MTTLLWQFRFTGNSKTYLGLHIKRPMFFVPL